MAAPGEILYLDSSALVKLIVPEPESAEVVAECGRWVTHASSVVAPVEVGLAVRRARPTPAVAARADQVLAAIDLVPLDPPVAEWARREAPPALRALAAIHIASALALDDDLGALLTYDGRQREAAEAAGIATLPRR